MLGRNPSGQPTFRHITVADGLPDADINRMVADKNGQVWVSTDNGLAQIDPDSFAVHAYKDADGVAISTYWNGSGDRTPRSAFRWTRRIDNREAGGRSPMAIPAAPVTKFTSAANARPEQRTCGRTECK